MLQDIPLPSITKLNWKIVDIKFHWILQGANYLMLREDSSHCTTNRSRVMKNGLFHTESAKYINFTETKISICLVDEMFITGCTERCHFGSSVNDVKISICGIRVSVNWKIIWDLRGPFCNKKSLPEAPLGLGYRLTPRAIFTNIV